MDEPFQRLREARIAKGFDTAAAAADAFGWNRNTYASNENGNAPFSYRKAKDYASALCSPSSMRVSSESTPTHRTVTKLQDQCKLSCRGLAIRPRRG